MKLRKRILNPLAVGHFPAEMSSGLRLAVAREEEAELSLLVDESEGVIVDAKFHCWGESYLIGALDAACEILLRKNIHQARRIGADLIDRLLRDDPKVPAFPRSAASTLNLAIHLIEKATDLCSDIEIEAAPLASPVAAHAFESSGDYPPWEALDKAEKLALIEEVIAKEIRPFIELDAGGVTVLDLIDDKEVKISYQGACTSCYSATGATLDAISGILRARVNPHIVVVPELTM